MNTIKTKLINFIWNGKDIIEFEEWLYEQNSITFEKLIGEESYIKLVAFNYKNKTLDTVKQFLKSILSATLIVEFDNEFQKRRARKVIKGICVKSEALDYSGNTIRNWDVVIGKEYEFLIIRNRVKNDNHKGYVNYINHDDLEPSGFIPISLFKIDNVDNISEIYIKSENDENEISIEPLKISKLEYIPTEYSFWEDYYNDDEKALKTYDEVLQKLGLKKVW